MLHATWQCQAFPSPAATHTVPRRAGARAPPWGRSPPVPRAPRKCWTWCVRRSSRASCCRGASTRSPSWPKRSASRERQFAKPSSSSPPGAWSSSSGTGASGILQTSIHDLEEIFEIRLMLEVPATAQAVGRMSPAEIRALRGQLGLMEQAAAAGDESRLWIHDRGFHHMLLAASGNRRLADYVDGLRDMVLVQGVTTAGRARSLAAIVAEHEAILECVEAGDARRCRCGRRRPHRAHASAAHRPGTGVARARLTLRCCRAGS